MRGIVHYEATIEPRGRRWLVRLHESRDFDGNGVFRPNPLISEKVGWYRWTEKRAQRCAERVIEKAYAREQSQGYRVVTRRELDDPRNGLPTKLQSRGPC